MQELDWTAIGQRIKKERERFGLTREQFAEKIGRSATFCRDMENGVSMSVVTLSKLAQVLEVSVDYLLYGKSAVSDGHLSSILSTCDAKEQDFMNSIVREFSRVYKPEDK